MTSITTTETGTLASDSFAKPTRYFTVVTSSTDDLNEFSTVINEGDENNVGILNRDLGGQEIRLILDMVRNARALAQCCGSSVGSFEVDVFDTTIRATWRRA